MVSWVVESSAVSPVELVRFSHPSAGHTFKFRKGLHSGEFITFDDFTWVQTHNQKVFCPF